MGLLAEGTALDWPDAKKNADQVREWGIKVEYLVVKYSKDEPKVLLSLRQADILTALAADEELSNQGGGVPAIQETQSQLSNPLPVFHPEFGRFMLEATPGKPWGIGLKELLGVEPDMKLRRKIAKEHMKSNEYPITLTTFPPIGRTRGFHRPLLPAFWLQAALANTPNPWKDPSVNYDLHNWPEDDDVRNGAAPDNFIHMDAMAFGMGSCCLQITFQAKNITEGRKMYDQLSPIGPIMLALTAATPIYKGFLADTDVRWNQISRAVDDRTKEELGEEPLKNSRWRIPKSRYASNSTYISTDNRLRPEYLDPDLIIDENIKDKLMEGGMDDRLATHFAHLFIRDPIVIFNEDLEELDMSKADHFENIQSTNWQHMRFKPPPAGSDIGWRVEFRPMEIQITDFENAAFSVFMVLITRAILSFDLNFYIPIAKVDENMETAHARDAVLNKKFYFRKNPFPTRQSRGGGASGTSTPMGVSRPPTPTGPVEDEYALMSIDEVINGSRTEDNDFPGLIPIVESYLDSVNVDVQTRCELATYLDLIRRRASGELWTAARWIRDFVDHHPAYQHDSVVGDEVTKDLVGSVIDITDREQEGKGWKGLDVPDLEKLLGRFRGGCK
ncbi:glutamate-cysteine ligase catalytic subunit [Apiospora hydei]|uniref:Glutamate--cysteine ligase n=1 Tax=Apiospora hydei TaxID=1337664 RepID=A0ABR1X3H2_9PEZI